MLRKLPYFGIGLLLVIGAGVLHLAQLERNLPLSADLGEATQSFELRLDTEELERIQAEARRQAEAAAQRAAQEQEEAARRAQEEARRLVPEEERRKAEDEARRRAEAEAMRRAEEARRRAEPRAEAASRRPEPRAPAEAAEAARPPEPQAERTEERVAAAPASPLPPPRSEPTAAPLPPPEVEAARPAPSSPLPPAEAAPAPPPAADVAAPEVVTVSRFPALEAPDSVAPGAEFPVQVWLSEENLTPEVEVKTGPGAALTPEGRLALTLPAGPATWDLEVLLFAPGFELARESKWSAPMRLHAQGDSEPAQFWLRARSLAQPKPRRRLHARLFHAGRYLGSISRDITVEGGQSGPSAALTLSAPPKTIAGAIELGPGAPAPDLDVSILYDEPGRLGRGTIHVVSPHIGGSALVEAFSTPPEIIPWLEQNYRRLVAAGSQLQRGLTRPGAAGQPTASKEETIHLARAFGRQLYLRYAPPALRKAFWALAAPSNGGRPMLRTIQITSNDPKIPWELIRPISEDGSKEFDFLGLEFRVARWALRISGRQLDKPLQTIPYRELVAIVPRYEGGEYLPFQSDELAALEHVAGYRAAAGNLAGLEALLKQKSASIVHFSGHGVFQKQDGDVPFFGIRLDDAVLDPLTWRDLAAPGDVNPFFFFNACDTGRAESVGGFVEGWGPAVLEAGASGFVGGLWPLFDKAAATFSTSFYEEFAKRLGDGSAPVTDILWSVRRRFYENGDPTYLAYTFYGDVNLRFVRN